MNLHSFRPEASPATPATRDVAAAQATARWLASRAQSTRGPLLHGVQVWLEYCKEHKINPLSVHPAHIVFWLDQLAGREASITMPAAMSTLHAWYAHLTDQKLCARNPMDRVGDPSPQPSSRITCHSLLASAVLVDYAETRALQASRDGEAGEIAWRNAALLSIWFHAGLTPRRLLSLGLDALALSPRHVRLSLGSDDPFALPDAAARPLRAYLERRSDRREQRLSELAGPLLATPSRAVSPRPDSRLTHPDVLAIMRNYAEQCALPYRPQLAMLEPRDGLTRLPVGDRTVLLITRARSSMP